MLSSCTNYLATMPAITIYMNCDTRLAINLKMFNLGDNDEFIFAIKNYDYIESGYEYLFRARKSDIDENGEVIFKISPKTSKRIKPGAFYNFAMFINAYDRKKPTEYKKLTENGEIHIEYGAQDMLIPNPTFNEDIVSAKLMAHDTPVKETENPKTGELIGGRLELIEEA